MNYNLLTLIASFCTFGDNYGAALLYSPLPGRQNSTNVEPVYPEFNSQFRFLYAKSGDTHSRVLPFIKDQRRCIYRLYEDTRGHWEFLGVKSVHHPLFPFYPFNPFSCPDFESFCPDFERSLYTGW